MSWIDNYIDFTSSQESPTIFHRWCALSVIASVLERRVWLDRRAANGVVYFTSYPGQLSVCLVAGAGRCKKSTAVNIAKPFMKAAGVQLFDGKITPERLLNKLGSMPNKRPVLTVVASELSAFLSKASYNDGLIDNLIKLLDCESNPYETNKGGVVNIANPCLTLLMATTPWNMGKAIPPQAHDSGFLSRHIFVYSEQPGVAQPLNFNAGDVDHDLSQRFEQLQRLLIHDLRAMLSLNGEFHWSDSGRRWYGNYYDHYRASPASEAEGYPQRRPDHLTRIAMCLRAARGGTLFLDEEDLVLADKYLTEIESDMHRAFAYIGQHVNAEQQHRIIAVLREAKASGKPLVNAQDLYYKTVKYFGSPNDLATQLGAMVDAGVVGTMGRDKATNKIQYILLREPY